MLYLKKLLKPLSYTFSILIIGTIIITLFSYISEGLIYKTIKFLIPIISILIGGIIIGKNSKNKGWFEGIKFGSLIVICLLIIGLILPNSFNIKSIIYYLVLIFISTIGSMLGISKNSEK